MDKHYDTLIVGAGAAGLMAGITAARRGQKVLLLEKMERPGRKLLITGKGRCNVTNCCTVEDFMNNVLSNKRFLYSCLNALNPYEVMGFFEECGVALKVERGERVFPVSDRAADIVDALVNTATDAGCRITRACVKELCIDIDSEGKRRIAGVLTEDGQTIAASSVIIATGGKSYPATGSTGDGYALAHAVGHAIEPIRPSLVPLETSLPDRAALEGLQLRNVRVALLVDGERVTDEFGEMVFSSRGVEGAVVLRMSRRAVDALIEGHKVELSLDLKPALDAETVRERIARERAALPAGGVVSDLLRKLMPREMMTPVARMIGTHPKRLLSSFTPAQEEELIRVLKDFRIPINDYRPFTEAIITAGGISVGEVNPRTLESLRIRGLYFAGEVLDLDANTGGYNLQIAFSTGRLAGLLRHEA